MLRLSISVNCLSIPQRLNVMPFLCSSVQIDSAAFLFIAAPSLNNAVLCRPMLFRCCRFIATPSPSISALCHRCAYSAIPFLSLTMLCRFISKPSLAMSFRCDAVHRLLSSTRSNSFSMYCYSISMLITAMPSHIAAMLSISFTPHCCAIPSPHLSLLCLFVAIPFPAVPLLC